MPFDYPKHPAPATTQCPDCGGYSGLKSCPTLCDDCYGNMHTGAACGPCTCQADDYRATIEQVRRQITNIQSVWQSLTADEVRARRRSAYQYAF